jgi:hypothetical protein
LERIAAEALTTILGTGEFIATVVAFTDAPRGRDRIAIMGPIFQGTGIDWVDVAAKGFPTIW